ncbi:MAG: 3-phosphoshikimate 1-carboxyvinyltransferase [Ferroplasma sp.]
MKARITANNIGGHINAPSSKSYAQRYILYSAFSGKEISLNGLSFSDDELIAIKVAEACKATVKYDKKNIHIIPEFVCPEKLYFGESGTSYRLSLGLLSGKKCKTSITGEQSLASRPASALIKALGELDVKFSQNSDNFYDIDARNAKNMQIEIDGSASSQFISAMLFYYSFYENSKFLFKNAVSKKYTDITIKCLQDFGISISEYNESYSVSFNGFKPHTIQVEGDYSSASYFIVLGILKGRIRIGNLASNSIQPDMMLIKLLNANSGINVYNDYIEVSPVSEINKITLDASISPDLAPIISVIGIFSTAGVDIYNYGRLKIKESDRLSGIIKMCRAFGASISVNKEFISIHKGIIKKPRLIDFDDHRMIMSSIIAALVADSPSEIANIEKINKSYPEFLNDLQRVGCNVLLLDSTSL